MGVLNRLFNRETKTAEQKKLHQKLGIEKTASQDEVNAAYINFAKQGNQIYAIYLTDAQWNNHNFLLELFDADYGRAFVGSLPKNLQSNIDFMVKYFTIKYSHFKEDYLKHGHSEPNQNIIRKIGYNKELVESPHFLTQLSKAIPELNLLNMVNEVLGYVYPHNRTTPERQALIEKIPVDVLKTQARKFGAPAIEELVSQHKSYPFLADVVSEGIKCDGFKSLKAIPEKDIAPNKRLIIEAAAIGGPKALFGYMTETVSCRRQDTEDHDFCGELFNAQKQLVDDKMFMLTVNKMLASDEDRDLMTRKMKLDIEYGDVWVKERALEKEIKEFNKAQTVNAEGAATMPSPSTQTPDGQNFEGNT